ncbi:uncharacterized protein MELLADRAFT_124456 [Melampsora larici-populina 98AG31]|uniref:Secreted protein n=1 Tax=Melampsora larici-populina (strain 98AG31 / pathotype 3-4-7) TaxID=747676 RepID=F4RMZ5_MELLP|nr:uncharacterized protein MELLADRAFT_124456 [Melampsora larici-populina 98AG31]EGG06206.1 secreted protein [Melampsora larici-populina 98AG31]
MRLSMYLLGLALAMFVALLTLAMEDNLGERVKLLEVAEPGQQSGTTEQTQFELHTATRSRHLPWYKMPFGCKEPLGSDLKSIPKFPATPGSVAIKYAYTPGKFRQVTEMDNFVDHVMALISKPPNPTDRSIHAALNKATVILGKQETTMINRFRTLGLLTEVLEPWKPKAREVLINKWPDRLKLELEATQAHLPINLEYAESMANYLLINAYVSDTKNVLDWSDMNECFRRAQLIGTYQSQIKDAALEKSEKKINGIVSKYLMKAQLPQAKRDVEELILAMQLNLREISSNTWEGEYSIDMLAHLFKYQSAVQTRLFELEKYKDFWKDMNLPQVTASLEALSKHESEFLQQETEKLKKLRSQPLYGDLKSVLENMKSSIESGDYMLGLQIYKLLYIGCHYNSGFEHHVYKLLFDGAHVPAYLANLWSHIHPQLVVEKDIRFYPYKIMIKEHPNYFCDAKRHILALKISEVRSESFSKLKETLNSLTVKPHQNIQEDTMKRVCREVLDCLRSEMVENEVSKTTAIAMETILRVLEYEPKSITYFLEYMDQDEFFRDILYHSARDLIQNRPLEKNSVPQLLGFMEQIVIAYKDIWSHKFPIEIANIHSDLDKEKSEEKVEKIKRAKDALKREITESQFF